MSEIKKRKKGQMLNSTERQLILNLMNYLKGKDSKKSISEIIREISKATGCSERTIYKVKKEGIQEVVNKRRLRKKENKNSRNVKYDGFVKSSIRKKIRNYFLRNDSPTLNKILTLVNNDPQLPNFKRSTLHTLLKEIGFVYEQIGNKLVLTERKDIVELRENYLMEIRRYREENKWIVFLGQTVISLVKEETFANSSEKTAEKKIEEGFLSSGEVIGTVFLNPHLITGTTLLYTIDSSELGNMITSNALVSQTPNTKNSEEKETKKKKETKKSYRELRLMVIKAGSEQGFIPDVDFIKLSKNKTEDVENYRHWFLETLLPKIPPGSVIVLDYNAPIDTVEENVPDGSWKKQKIKDWLLSKNIKIEKLVKKKELLVAVNNLRPIYSLNYKIYESAKEKGIVILSLPPFHYELNPLSTVWAQIKFYVSSNMKCFKVKKIKELIKEGFHSVSQFSWMNSIQEVREVEDLFFAFNEHKHIEENHLQIFSVSS